jgi:hypothetical protein
MRVLALIGMMLGLALMSAPFILPRLGITLVAPAPQSEPARPAEGAGALAGIGNLLADGVGSAAAYLGVAPEGATPTPAEAAADIAAACGALEGDADCSPGSGADFAETFGEAAGMVASGEMPPEAFATAPGAAPGPVKGVDRAPGVSIIETSARPSQGGAKFFRARETAPGDGTL